jgi:hypothetical protein
MEKPLLTFDMDGVLCRPPFGINPGTGKGKRRDKPGKRDVLWLTERWRYLGRKPMPHALDGFRELSDQFRCVVVTGRSVLAEGLTRRWYEKHLGFVPELHMRPSWRETSAQFKARTLTELQPVAHFEDDPFTADWAADIVERVFLVDWARNRWLDRPNVHRVGRIAEALPILQSGASSE